MTTELIVLISIVVGLAILVWLFLGGEMKNVWPVEETAEKNLKTKTMVWGFLILGGTALTGVGLLHDSPVVIAGVLVAVVGLNFFLAYRYKIITGRATSGMRFGRWWSKS